MSTTGGGRDAEHIPVHEVVRSINGDNSSDRIHGLARNFSGPFEHPGFDNVHMNGADNDHM